MALADPDDQEVPAGDPALGPRKPSGELRDFDEIVSPHPFVAFLFRRRTFLVLLGVLLMVPWARPEPVTLLAGLALGLIAEAWRIWAAGTIHKTEQLTTAGPYGFVRHPLYVGSFAHAIAYSLMSGRWESFLFVPPLFMLIYGAAVSTEEAMLHKLFPQEYAEYCARVPRFIPRLRRPLAGAGAFSWRQVAENKEYVNVIWMIVLSTLFTLRMWVG